MSLKSPAESASSGGSAAEQASNSKAVERAARIGFLAKGLVYALVGALALQIAMGQSEQADQKGALREVASRTGGTVILWLMVLGFVGYGIWRLSQATWGRRDETDEKKRTAKRLGSAANGLVYLAFALLALRVVTTSGSSGSGSSSLTAEVLGWPAGQAMVFTAGLVVIAVAAGLTWRGVKTDFEKNLNTGQMSPQMFRAVHRLGQVGYIARGVVFALVGVLVCKAALDHQPGKAAGFDVALQKVAAAPYGPYLLTAAALGLISFGVFCMLEARYRRL